METQTPEIETKAPEVETPTSTAQEMKKPKDVAVVGGILTPANSSELVRMLENIAAGGGFPERFKTPAERVASYNLARSLMGDRWQIALNHIAIIKGQMTIYGELPGALAEQTGEVLEKEVYCLDAEMRRIGSENKNLDSPPFAGVCIIQRKGRAKKEFFYTMNDAKTAEQYPPTKWDHKEKRWVPNLDSPWMKFTKIMLMRKAMALGVKFEFPDAVAGAKIAEYDFDVAPDLQPSIEPEYRRLDGQKSSLAEKFGVGGSGK